MCSVQVPALLPSILAAELLFVFGYLAVAGSRRPKLRDWLAAAAMSAGIGLFLRLASPSGGRLHAPGSSWLLAGLVTAGVVLAALAVAFGFRGRPGAPQVRRAGVLGSATGISWGFMAAVIKELSSHLGDGIDALVTTWSPYVLLVAGAATMLLVTLADKRPWADRGGSHRLLLTRRGQRTPLLTEEPRRQVIHDGRPDRREPGPVRYQGLDFPNGPGCHARPAGCRRGAGCCGSGRWRRR